MEPSKFKAKLASLGFSGSINDTTITSLMEEKTAQPFISWLMEHIEDFEVLSKEEFKEYKRIKDEGKPILEPQELSQYLPKNDNEESSTVLKTSRGIEDSTVTKKAYNEQLKHLMKKKKMLSTLLSESKVKMDNLEHSLKRTKIDCEMEYSGAENQTIKLDEKLVDLKASLWNLVEAYRDTNNFMSQLKLDDYFEAEDGFTAALTKYTKKQFFEGIADIVGTKDKSRFELLEISKPEHLLVKGQDQSMISQQSKELLRLQSLYARSQKCYIESSCTLKSIEAELSDIESQLSDAVLKPVHHSEGSLIKSVKEIDMEIVQERELMLRLIREELLPVLAKLGELESTTILSGNYDLKIARQDYFLSKQDEVIKQLVIQSSRYDLLSMLFEVEAKFHRHSYHLLTAMKELIVSNRTEAEKRIVLDLANSSEFALWHRAIEQVVNDVELEEIATVDGDEQKVVLEEADDILPRHESSAESKQQLLFKSFDMLQSNAEKCLSNSTEMLKSEQALTQEYQTLMETLENELRHCEGIVFGSSAEDGRKELDDLPGKIEQLENSLTTVEKSVKDVIKDLDAKKKILATDPLKALERTLFPVFFQDPIRLRRLFSELETRMESATTL